MLKTPVLPALSRPKLLLWLLVLLLMLITAWQGTKLAKLGPAWQALPQRMQATPLVDYAEQEAIRVLIADNSEQAQRLVTELTAATLISSAQLYGEDGQLLAQSDENLAPATSPAEPEPVAASEPVLKQEPKQEQESDSTAPPKNSEIESSEIESPEIKDVPPEKIAHRLGLTYVRPLYQDEQPLGFLRLQLANNPLSLAQHGIWQQLKHHLSWLLPLSLLLGLLLGLGLQHTRQRWALRRNHKTPKDLAS